MEMKIETERMGAWEALIRTVGSLLKTFERELLEEEGLPLTWYDVLVQLNDAPQGQLRMQVLADSAVLSRSGLTRLIDTAKRVVYDCNGIEGHYHGLCLLSIFGSP